MIKTENSVCFIGHRKIKNTPELQRRIYDTLSGLILNGTINFIFGDHSEFNDLCYKIVTDLKTNYPQIRRIHFRKVYENADDYTMKFLTFGYEESICPERVGEAGRASYIERNRAMIIESACCIFYYDKDYAPKRSLTNHTGLTNRSPKSGTAIAFRYAKSKNKCVINLFA